MIDPIFQANNYQLARKLLDASVLQNEAIATNVANAETPGFRRLQVSPDFAAQLSARMAAGEGARSLADLQPKLVEDSTARSTRPDGNTVELQTELLAMDQNTVQFNYLSGVVTNDLKQLRMAIQGHAM